MAGVNNVILLIFSVGCPPITLFFYHLTIYSVFFFFRYDDKYNLTLSVKDGKTGKIKTSWISKSVANYIDENGIVIHELIEPDVTKLHNSLLSEKKEK